MLTCRDDMMLASVAESRAEVASSQMSKRGCLHSSMWLGGCCTLGLRGSVLGLRESCQG